MNTLSFKAVGVSSLQPGQSMEVKGITITRDPNNHQTYLAAGTSWVLQQLENGQQDLVVLANNDETFKGIL